MTATPTAAPAMKDASDNAGRELKLGLPKGSREQATADLDAVDINRQNARQMPSDPTQNRASTNGSR